MFVCGQREFRMNQLLASHPPVTGVVRKERCCARMGQTDKLAMSCAHKNREGEVCAECFACCVSSGMFTAAISDFPLYLEYFTGEQNNR